MCCNCLITTASALKIGALSSWCTLKDSALRTVHTQSQCTLSASRFYTVVDVAFEHSIKKDIRYFFIGRCHKNVTKQSSVVFLVLLLYRGIIHNELVFQSYDYGIYQAFVERVNCCTIMYLTACSMTWLNK